MEINNKTFVVTGGGNGMGREITLALLAKGGRVAAVDMNVDALAETAKLAGDAAPRLSTHILNITDRAAVEALPEKVIAAHGAVDGLINNAGIIQPFVRVNDLPYAAIERVMNVNFYGTLYMTKTFLPHLLQRPEGHVVNISSMGGFLPVPGQSVYGASKAAIKLLTEGLRAELIDTRVHVTVVFPGAIGTNIINNSGAGDPARPMPEAKDSKMKPMVPAKAAGIIVRGIEKSRARVFVGGDSKLLDFLYRLSPGFATNLITGQMKALLAG